MLTKANPIIVVGQWQRARLFQWSIETMTMKFYDDDGTEINPDLIPKPDICVTCAKDNVPRKEEMLCTMTRADQQGEDEFSCEAYQPK